MSDYIKRLDNYRPGDDGNLTTGDFHKLVTEVFLAAMRSHYDMVAEEWRSKKPTLEKEAAMGGLPPYIAFRKEWLDGVEQIERARAEDSVKRILALQARPRASSIKVPDPTELEN